MKRIPCFLFTLLVLSLSHDIQAQTEESIDEFVSRIDDYLQTISKGASGMKIRKSLSSRKVRMEGKCDNGTKIIRLKIKHYKGGLEKEKITVIIPLDSKPYVLLKIIRIDDHYFYIKRQTYSSENPNKVIATEKLIDEKIYRCIVKNKGSKKTFTSRILEI